MNEVLPSVEASFDACAVADTWCEQTRRQSENVGNLFGRQQTVVLTIFHLNGQMMALTSVQNGFHL